MLMMPFSFLLDGTRPRPVLKTTLLRTLLIALAAGLGPLSNATEAPLYLQQALDRARVGGEGDYRWFGLKIYEARLWVGNLGYRPDMPEQLPFALELRYARSLAGDRIARASIDEMRKLGRGSERQHVAWLAAMQQLFPLSLIHI